MTHLHVPAGRSFATFFLLLLGGIAFSQDQVPVGKLPLAKLQKLADSGDPAAETELGLRYRLGDDVEKDPAKAVQWFAKAARQGYAKAYFNLGAAYYNGDGVPVNDETSCVWFLLAADAGDPKGQEALDRVRQEGPSRRITDCEVLAATAYVNGSLIKTDYGKAMQWYSTAAKAGNGMACERVAYLYDRGLGTPVDKQESFLWLKKSVDLGYDPAMFELGRAYELGISISQNLNEAKKLYEQAAGYGQRDALAALGHMYEDGRGVKADNQKAFAYYLVAAQDGDADSKKKADELAAKLTPKQIAAAKQDAAKLYFHSAHPLALIKK